MSFSDLEKVESFAAWLGNCDNSEELLNHLYGLICMNCGKSRPSLAVAAGLEGNYQRCCYPKVY